MAEFVFEVGQDVAPSDGKSVEDYVNLMNGIVYDCYEYDGYDSGNRNTIAVNLTVGSVMLGLDPRTVLNAFMNAGLINPQRDDEKPWDRVARVMRYADRFNWEWMIDPDQHAHLGQYNTGEVKFRISR